MTRSTTRMGQMKAAAAVLAVLYAVAALATLATATFGGGRSTPAQAADARPLEPSPLGR